MGDMAADFFTKPLEGSWFCKLREIVLNPPDECDRKISDANDENKLTNAAASQGVCWN